MVKNITCTIEDKDYMYINELDKPVRFYISLGISAFKNDYSPEQIENLNLKIKNMSLLLEKVLREKEELIQKLGMENKNEE